MSSRDEILGAVRAQSPRPAELPALDERWITYEQPRAQFEQMLESVGGRAVSVRSPAELADHVNRLATSLRAKTVASLVPGIKSSGIRLEGIDDPHDLEHVALTVAPGELAVAENGAVWVNGQDGTHRVLYFLCQHLALVVPSSGLVHNMHQAYERLTLKVPGFGVFISGPSKTADIEQSLVIGAHGARSLTVFFVD